MKINLLLRPMALYSGANPSRRSVLNSSFCHPLSPHPPPIGNETALHCNFLSAQEHTEQWDKTGSIWTCSPAPWVLSAWRKGCAWPLPQMDTLPKFTAIRNPKESAQGMKDINYMEERMIPMQYQVPGPSYLCTWPTSRTLSWQPASQNPTSWTGFQTLNWAEGEWHLWPLPRLKRQVAKLHFRASHTSASRQATLLTILNHKKS